MKKNTKYVLIALALTFTGYAGYTIYAMYKAGWNDFKSLVTAPFTYFGAAAKAARDSVTAAVDNVTSGASAAVSIPGLITQSENLNNQITAQNNSDYAPGGRIYNQIMATRGQQAADAAWNVVQQHDAAMTAQTAADKPWYQFW